MQKEGLTSDKFIYFKKKEFLFFFDYNLFIFYSLLSVWLDWFHNFNCFILFFIVFFVFFDFIFLFFLNFFFKLELSYNILEFWICFFPVCFLFFQVLPSLFLLFLIGGFIFDSDLTIKIIAHQWYWTYELGNNLGFFFDSYIISEDIFSFGDFRLLEVDSRLVLPVGYYIHFILTSSDVIHSWRVNSFFLKVDAISGLINILDFFFEIIGIFYGQCSEICGINHSFIPIVLELTLIDFFKDWILFFF